MSVFNKFIPNEQAVPVFETDAFVDEPTKRFALTVLGKGSIPAPGNEDVFDAYLRLRANVYIDQTRMLEEEVRRDDDTEMDSDDERSLHIAILENRSSIRETTRRYLSKTAVIGAMRVIEKEEDNNELLPIEDFFKEELGGEVTPTGSVEISRYIIRHENKREAALMRGLMHATALAYIVQNDLGPTLAVVEPELETTLSRQGVPLRRMTEPKLVPKYNDWNLGIEIDTDAYANQYGRDTILNMNTTPSTYTYWGDVEPKDETNGIVAS